LQVIRANCFSTAITNQSVVGQLSRKLAYLIPAVATFNPNWHELRKQEKCSSLAPHRSKFYKTQWAWQSVKLTRLMSIFTSKNIWKYLIQIELTKSNPKITRGVKVPCLMPIRVNSSQFSLLPTF
jgi:hypothetical protein